MTGHIFHKGNCFDNVVTGDIFWILKAKYIGSSLLKRLPEYRLAPRARVSSAVYLFPAPG